jgi:hypothetical protein
LIDVPDGKGGKIKAVLADDQAGAIVPAEP